MEYPDIARYAMVGDSRTAVLISHDGSIDWLCIPRFDSPSMFNRLLDWNRGGHFSIAPASTYTAQRRYQDESAILVTEFKTDQGSFRVTDAMPVMSETDKASHLSPLFSLLRYVEGLQGNVPFVVSFKPRPAHGRVIPAFHRRPHAGYFSDLGGRMLHLATEMEFEINPGELSGQFTIGPGESLAFWMAYSEDAPAVYPILQEAVGALDRTLGYWRKWADQCVYEGRYRKQVMRSALTLKLLGFAPSGAIVAAPTTSLPEVIGGTRNWDYRYCWLRDASLTAQVFFRLGFATDGEAFVRWLLHATALTYPRLQVFYDVHGEASVPERCLEFLRGYRESVPVRVGNSAHDQYQLDVYGHVFEALRLFLQATNQLDSGMRRRLIKMTEVVIAEWSRPDHGMWEISSARKHYIHSKVMCWVALDRAEKIVRQLGMPADVERWSLVRDDIRANVLRLGYSPELRSFVQSAGENNVDALALTFPLLGFLDGNDSRIRSTIQHVTERLGVGDLLYRYRADDGLPGKEGAFLACSFWLVEALTVSGKRYEAERLFERLQSIANDVGLYAEEINPANGEMLGNFPQALTHLAHISAALRLDHKL